MAESKAKKEDLVKLVFPHEQGEPGTVKSFFNIECVAREGDGLYEAEIPYRRAVLELKRKNPWKFVRPETLEDLEEI